MVKCTRQDRTGSLVYTLSERTGRCLEYLELPTCDLEDSCLALEPPDETGLEQVVGSSIICRNAVGPHQGNKAFSSQTLLPEGDVEAPSATLASSSGFTLHAEVVATRHERQKLMTEMNRWRG